jgi:hypothetical protein
MTRKQKEYKIVQLLVNVEQARNALATHHQMIKQHETRAALALVSINVTKRELYKLGWKG